MKTYFPVFKWFFSSSADLLVACHLEGTGKTTRSISGDVMFNLVPDGSWKHALSVALCGKS